jgi:hypothetical protein
VLLAEEFVEVLRGKFAEKLHWYQSISINFSVAEDV